MPTFSSHPLSSHRSAAPMRWFLGASLALLFCSTLAPAWAGLTVTVDKESLDEILEALTAQELSIQLPTGAEIQVQLDDLEITRLQPSAPDGPSGWIDTRVRVRAQSLGLDMKLQPRLTMRVLPNGSKTMLEVRFSNVELNFGLAKVDLGAVMPAMRYEAEQLGILGGAGGDVGVLAKMREVEIQAEQLLFHFDLAVTELDTSSNSDLGGN